MHAIAIVTPAYQAHDAYALPALYAEGATYSNPRAGKVSPPSNCNYTRAGGEAYPDWVIPADHLITAGDTEAGLVAVRSDCVGTHAGTLPDGTPATGGASPLPGASFTQVDGDKVLSEQIYFDRQDLLSN
jgi:hypothetical protein